MKRTLGLTAISGLLVGCNLLLGTEAPILREAGSGGAGGAAVVATVGAGGGEDPISILDGSGAGGSASAGGGPTVCGDGSWAHWPPSGAHEYGIFTGATLEKTITDGLTGLEWQEQGSETAVSWSEASAHCKLLKWAEKTGWRLPTRIELLSIVDYKEAYPSIDGKVFPSTTSDQYWTSSLSTYVPEPTGTAFWRVSFTDGGAFPGMTSSGLGQVRCVRGGAPLPAGGTPHACDRYDLTETTAKDIETGLTWERSGSDKPLSRQDAAARCTQLPISGPAWRLPTIAELSSIIDEEKVGSPRLDPVAFPAGLFDQADWYWSSTGDAEKPGAAAWSVRVLYGTVTELASPGQAYVRCVY